jgi:hypothetical protein
MPRYTFTAPTGRAPITIELRDNDAAWAEAITFCGEMLRDLDGSLPSQTNWQMVVTNAKGEPVAEIDVRARRREPA